MCPTELISYVLVIIVIIMLCNYIMKNKEEDNDNDNIIHDYTPITNSPNNDNVNPMLKRPFIHWRSPWFAWAETYADGDLYDKYRFPQ